MYYSYKSRSRWDFVGWLKFWSDKCNTQTLIVIELQLELSNDSSLAQQSIHFFIFPFAAKAVQGERRTTCTNDGKEIFNVEFATICAKDGLSFGISGGSIENYVGHETEIHGTDIFPSIKYLRKC